ncbi:unnamed protein product [Rhizoctonia solani]|uniref:Carrier domain-containing protein n=1 Tax=Rhizoctonia solani TaxID=456999 RepID=A0A8H3I126_9AGAM|nr:unnamed protein product [Rhizoctonia solani]
MKAVIFGGGPLTDEIGDKLVSDGLRIHSGYGATEFGTITVLPPRDQPDAWPWNYLRFSHHVKPHFIPQNDQDNAFELVFEPGEDHSPFVLNGELDGKAVYKTRDLIVSHPSKPNVWKFIGRVDDQIVLLNGEKTNPGPMETEIVKCPLVQGAVVFGQARNQTGVLIELKETSESLSEMGDSRKESIGEVWPYIERANQSSSTHSRLDKRAIIFVDPARPLPRTPKGTITRSAAVKLYARDIEGMYEALEHDIDAGAAAEVRPPVTWSDLGVVSDWIAERVKSILARDIDTTADLFQQGMDSLTATILLRDLRASLHASQDPIAQTCAQTLPRTLVFDNPTVQQLAHFLVQHTASPDASSDPTLMVLESIHAMIRKYDSEWPQSSSSHIRRSDTPRERVIVTGTTGGLGSHILAQLLASDNVDRVWALNRKSGGDIRNRQRVSFEDKLLDVELLASEKLVFVDAVLDETKLGLSHELYDEIRDTATVIIHNAWQVNFNLTLQSFEPNIRGTRNLLDLALDSTASSGLPRFAFASSISAAGTSGLGGQLEEISICPEDAMPTLGYGQSKLVAEKLLESARRAGLQTCIVRLGQLTGDINSGSWDTTNWVPSIVASSVSVGCLPAAVGTVSWLPLDIAARSIIDTCITCDEELPPVIHASHPLPVPWVDIMTAFSEVLTPHIGCSLPVVELEEWNKRVAQKAANFQGSDVDRYQRYPSTKIQGMVDGMAHADQLLRSRDEKDVESAGTVRLVTRNAERISKGLKSTPGLGKAHVEKWVKYWEPKGLFVGPI